MPDYRLYKLKNPDAFELISKDCMEEKYFGHFTLYGRQGQKQHGIDAYNYERTVCLQCKNYQKPDELTEQVKKDFLAALSQFPKMETFVVATALDRDIKLQDELDDLMYLSENQARQVTIESYFWEDLEEIIYTSARLKIRYERLLVGKTFSQDEAEVAFESSIEPGIRLFDYLCERLCAMRDEHPSFRLMARADEALFPNGREYSLDIQAEYDEIPSMSLSEIFQNSWKQEKRNHILLEGEGGIGKTVTMLSLATRRELLPKQVAVIYIPLYRLDIDSDNPIDEFIDKFILLDPNTRAAYHKEIEHLRSMTWNQGPRLIVLLDGFNEIPYPEQFQAKEKIKEWLERSPSVQMIASSRDNLRGDMALWGIFHDVRLQKLSYETIRNYLSAARLPIPTENEPITNVINRPLMLALYAKTNKLLAIGDTDLSFKTEPYNAGKIIWNYLQTEISHIKSQHKANTTTLSMSAVICEFIVPAMGYLMVLSDCFLLPKGAYDSFFKIAYKKFTECHLSGILPDHLAEILEKYYVELFQENSVKTFLRSELCIFKERKNKSNRNEYILMHQDFRDCFAAIHLINTLSEIRMTNSLPTPWHKPIGLYVIRFVADIIDMEEANYIWKVNQTLMQSTDNIALTNMMNLQGAIRSNDYSELDFSGIDFSCFNLLPYRKSGSATLAFPKLPSLLKNTKFSMRSFSSIENINSINVVAITPDGKNCVSASTDGKLRIWDIENGCCIQVLDGHENAIKAVVITSDGKYGISTSIGGELRVWNMMTGVLERKYRDGSRAINAVAITPDMQYCISASNDGIIKVNNIRDDVVEDPLFGHQFSINALAITSDGKQCVSASNDETLRVWSIEDGSCKRVLCGHMDGVSAVAISPDDIYCVSASWDKTLRIWNIQSGECEHILTENSDRVSAVAITPDGKHCVSTSWDGRLCIWSMETGEQEYEFPRSKSRINSVAITPDGEKCITALHNGTLDIWNMKSRTQENHIRILAKLDVKGIDFSQSSLDSEEIKNILYQNGAIVG